MTSSATGAATPRLRGALSYDERSAVLCVASLAAVLLAVAVCRILYSFYVSLFSLKLTRPGRMPFVGLDNYVAVLSDSHFWLAVERTAYFSVLSVVAIAVLALLVALLLNEEFPGRRALGAILLTPSAIPYLPNSPILNPLYHPNYGALTSS